MTLRAVGRSGQGEIRAFFPDLIERMLKSPLGSGHSEPARPFIRRRDLRGLGKSYPSFGQVRNLNGLDQLKAVATFRHQSRLPVACTSDASCRWYRDGDDTASAEIVRFR